MILRFLNVQGIAGLAASLALLGLLLLQKGETRHWRKQSAQLEQLYRAERAALAETVANYRAAAEVARAADRDAAEQTRTAQDAINERISNEFQARLADVRAHASGLRRQDAAAPADPGRGGAAPMPGLPGSAARATQAPGEDRLPAEDALIATEQAIQLDELIRWVRQQSAVDPNAGPRR